MTATMGGVEGGGEARREEKEAEMKAAMPKDSAEDAMQCDCCIGNATNHECNSSNIAANNYGEMRSGNFGQNGGGGTQKKIVYDLDLSYF